MLFAFDETVDRHGNIISSEARALILQAKVASTYSQLKSPSVPITRCVGSTARELSFLSRWPEFSLYKTGRSNRSPITSFGSFGQVSPVPPPFAWYIVAPKCRTLKVKISSAWRSWWMAGPASSGNACATTFGDLIVSFLAARPARTQVGNVEVGKEFAWGGVIPNPRLGNDWARLCYEILDLAKSGIFPPSLAQTGMPESRIASMNPLMYFGVRMLHRYDDLSLLSEYLLAQQFKLGNPTSGRPFPVVIMTVTRFGEEERETLRRAG